MIRLDPTESSDFNSLITEIDNINRLNLFTVETFNSIKNKLENDRYLIPALKVYIYLTKYNPELYGVIKNNIIDFLEVLKEISSEEFISLFVKEELILNNNDRLTSIVYMLLGLSLTSIVHEIKDIRPKIEE